MTRQLAFLRGINLGSHRRVAMPALRELLTEAGWVGVRTYVQSGNVAFSSPLAPAEAETEAERLIAERFGFSVEVLVRTHEELAEVVRANPLGAVASDPKRHQVTFLRSEPSAGALEKLAALDLAPEQFAVAGREVYSWHPEGVGRSKLWSRLATDRWLGTCATARNWTTVTTMLELAAEEQ